MAVDLLNISYYNQANPDLAQNGLVTEEQLRNHFFQSGLAEGRQFNPLVDLNFYRASNGDLTTQILPSNGDLYNHLSNDGVREGRRFSPFYDTTFYKSSYGDLGNLDNESLFNHVQNSGINEGRQFSPLVDLSFYLSLNPDLNSLSDRRAVLNHLQLSGINEERRFSPVLDLGFYRDTNQDLKVNNLTGRNLFNHFTFNGINEGRRASVSYESGFYLNNNTDLQAAGLRSFELLNHFALFGVNEGRSSSDYFNGQAYINSNADLAPAGINTGSLGQRHFEQFGFREGRSSGGVPLLVPTEPGNELGSAANLGLLSNARGGTVSQQVSNSDNQDYYRFVLGATSTVNLGLSGFNRPLELQLIYDRNGNGVHTIEEEILTQNGSTAFNFSRTLGRGTYYLQVIPPTGTTTTDINYNLNLSAAIAFESPVGLEPGNTLGTAFNVGTLGNVTISNFVGTSDPADVYRFEQPGAGVVNFTVSNVAAPDRVRLLVITDSNNNGQADNGETVFNSGPFNGTRTFTPNLPVGTHYLRLEQFNRSDNSTYTVNLRRV